MDNILPIDARSTRKVFIETFGCQMNDNDSERILGFLRDIDYTSTDVPEEADLIIVNTCSIRDKAEKKVYSTLGRYRSLKAARPGLIIGVAGCVAQQAGEKLFSKAPYLDLVFGTHNIHRIKDLLKEVSENNRRVAATEFNPSIDPDEYAYARRPGEVKATVSIMRGCDNYCAYCIVPYTRGREFSRPFSDIIAEITALASDGVKEVTLIGQNVNSYGLGGDVSFPGLLRMAAQVAGIERIRFVTSHPKDISGELIGLFGEEEKLCRHLHLPVQSGSDSILRAMGRGYTRDEYLAKVRTLRGLYPDMAITTDIIVGFPGETEEDFGRTMSLLEEVRFDNIFSFMYSPRPGTRAAGFPGQLPLDVKSRRLQALQQAQKGITSERNNALVGRVMKVLIEGASKSDPAEQTGRTSCGRIVNLPGPRVPAGTLVDVEITAAYANSLRGSHRERGALCC